MQNASCKGNWLPAFGVYTSMRLLVWCFLGSFAALAQPPRQEPMDGAIQAVIQERNLETRAPLRDQARDLLQHAPANWPSRSPERANWMTPKPWRQAVAL